MNIWLFGFILPYYFIIKKKYINKNIFYMKNILKIFCQAQVMQYDQHAKNELCKIWVITFFMTWQV